MPYDRRVRSVRWKYLFVSSAVGLLWYPALRMAPPTRKALTHIEMSLFETLGLFLLSGLGVAHLFRRWISNAKGLGNVFLGAGIPFAATFVFILLLLAYKAVSGKLGGGDIGSALFWGPMFVGMSAYVVIPMGILSQYALKWSLKSEETERGPSWLRGGITGLILGGIVCILVIAEYPAIDNLYIIWPIYLLCGGGLDCAFKPLALAASLVIHAAGYFGIGAAVGWLWGKGIPR